MLKSSKGITLVALVITIIVLLILAGVTLNILLNNNLIEKSENSADQYKYQQKVEENYLQNISDKANYYFTKIDSSSPAPTGTH